MFLKQFFKVLGTVVDVLTIAVISVYEYKSMGCLHRHLGALVVAGGSAYPTLCITIHRQSCNVEHPSAYTFVWFAFLSNAQCQGVAYKLIGIKAANAVAVGNARKIDKVNKRVYLIQLLALHHAAYKCLCCRSVTAGILAA